MLAEQIKRLGSVILGGVPVEALELAEGTVRIKDNPEAALPFMACGAIINANNAGLPEDLDVTLNCRYVYRPPFEVPDVERKFGNLTLTYAAQIHAAVVEIDPGDRATTRSSTTRPSTTAACASIRRSSRAR